MERFYCFWSESWTDNTDDVTWFGWWSIWVMKPFKFRDHQGPLMKVSESWLGDDYLTYHLDRIGTDWMMVLYNCRLTYNSTWDLSTSAVFLGQSQIHFKLFWKQLEDRKTCVWKNFYYALCVHKREKGDNVDWIWSALLEINWQKI